MKSRTFRSFIKPFISMILMFILALMSFNCPTASLRRPSSFSISFRTIIA